jgi:N-ethylmaleimide reductase
LIVSEGTQPSDDEQGYLTTPGVCMPTHVEGWRKVAAAAHDKGSYIFIQLMHTGRMSHPDNTPHVVKRWHPLRWRRERRCSPLAG